MEKQQGIFERFALRISDWSEKWFPDSYILLCLASLLSLLPPWVLVLQSMM